MAMQLSEILMHLGENREDYFNAVTPPVVQSSNFAFPTLDAFRHALASEADRPVYTRGDNPTVHILREKLAALEKTEDALVFGSGMAAISAAVLANVHAGAHVACVNAPYSWARSLMGTYLPRFGVSCTFVDGQDLAAVEGAIREETTLLYLESPNSLTFELQDLAACAALAKRRGIVTCIDNSYASPVFQNPAALGIDLVVHSGTKYLNGHSDVVFGAVCSTREQISKIFKGEYMTLGGVLSPHDAALALRGLRTLELRMERSHRTACDIAARLEAHPAVASVNYPWLPSFGQHELARRQMSGAGGLLSFYLKTTDFAEAEAFFDRLEHFLLAVSWGGHESLVLPSAAFYKVPGREDPPVPWALVRLYLGLEDTEWLWADLKQALDAVQY